MKIAHFAIYAPHGSGQYETVKDLILAERSVGINAQFIDFAHDGKMSCRKGLQDGEIITVPVSFAEEADVIISHSAVPEELLKNKPSILALHGRPEYSFRLEFNGISPVLSTIINRASKYDYNAYITFWSEFLFPWSRILAGKKVSCVPSPVDFNVYKPEGEKHIFSEYGTPNIVIADMWREDVTPFNLIFAAQYFKEHFQKNAKLHVYGVSKNVPKGFLKSF